MITHPRRLRFKVISKNPLAEKLKEKHQSSIFKGQSTKNQLLHKQSQESVSGSIDSQ